MRFSKNIWVLSLGLMVTGQLRANEVGPQPQDPTLEHVDAYKLVAEFAPKVLKKIQKAADKKNTDLFAQAEELKKETQHLDTIQLHYEAEFVRQAELCNSFNAPDEGAALDKINCFKAARPDYKDSTEAILFARAGNKQKSYVLGDKISENIRLAADEFAEDTNILAYAPAAALWGKTVLDDDTNGTLAKFAQIKTEPFGYVKFVVHSSKAKDLAELKSAMTDELNNSWEMTGSIVLDQSTETGTTERTVLIPHVKVIAQVSFKTEEFLPARDLGWCGYAQALEKYKQDKILSFTEEQENFISKASWRDVPKEETFSGTYACQLYGAKNPLQTTSVTFEVIE